MKRSGLPFLPYMLGLLIGAAVTLHVLPGRIMARAMDRIESLGGDNDGARHAPRVTAENQTIVRASPDILYSVCLFDLTDGPIRVAAIWPADGNYASVSFYDANTNNFRAINDRDAEALSTSISLARPFDSDIPERTDESAWSPTTTGLILYRRVIDASTDLAAAETERQGFTCTQMADQ
ncbi:hypothetical protein AWH62_13010 [Maricaulis sp. W15]|uniref:DUF1254 domain-containing protein n=1 Tax=Maricaulis sp. W15 TaxID=1772333 RepID=UPI00094896E4|nr:DUF1254 domain-containing protein [Maricaulis sp. W15]OLF71458.1 hypothetical protein AWH62_13010 [Maricaulis sp. W15]